MGAMPYKSNKQPQQKSSKWSYTHDFLKQTGSDKQKETWKSFNWKNITTDQKASMMQDVYGGYDHGSGYFQHHAGWRGIADKMGMDGGAQTNADVAKLYDYVSGYNPSNNAKAAPAKTTTAAVLSPSNTTPAGKQYQSQIAALTASLAAQKKQAAAAQAAAQKTAAANFQSQLSKMQGLYASNLQSTKDQFGLQIKGLQSSVSGLQTNISNNAAAYQQNIADQATQFKAEQQTMQTNQERARQAGASPQLRLQEAQDMKQAGTKNFKKRFGSQFNPSAYGSLASIKSGTLNI